MNETRFDIVTVVFSADLRLLQLQARSLARFANAGLVGKIHVIVNDVCFNAVHRRFMRKILPEYGVLSRNVRLHDYRALWSSGVRKAGWRSQQAIKLLAANLVDTENFLILDAKNHLIRPLMGDALIAEDGRLRSHMYRIHPGFEDHFRRACAYFGYMEKPDLKLGLPTTTPFLMKRSLVMDMMTEMEEREAMPFPDVFMKDRYYTEFYLYYGYILGKFGSVEDIYIHGPKPVATLFAGQAKDVGACTKELEALNQDNVYAMGIHREVLKEANPVVIGLIKAAWDRFGLVTDEREQAYFALFQDRFPSWRRFLPF